MFVNAHPFLLYGNLLLPDMPFAEQGKADAFSGIPAHIDSLYLPPLLCVFFVQFP
jgi:hypothetical protein